MYKLEIFFYFFSSTFFLNLLVKSKEIGVAMNSDEYVPTMIPTNKAKMNPLIEAPPKTNIANNTTMVDNEVLNVRRNVESSTHHLLLVHHHVWGIVYGTHGYGRIQPRYH